MINGERSRIGVVAISERVHRQTPSNIGLLRRLSLSSIDDAHYQPCPSQRFVLLYHMMLPTAHPSENRQGTIISDHLPPIQGVRTDPAERRKPSDLSLTQRQASPPPHTTTTCATLTLRYKGPMGAHFRVRLPLFITPPGSFDPLACTVV